MGGLHEFLPDWLDLVCALRTVPCDPCRLIYQRSPTSAIARDTIQLGVSVVLARNESLGLQVLSLVSVHCAFLGPANSYLHS